VQSRENDIAAPTPNDKQRPRRSDCLEPAEELDVLIRARYPIIYVLSWEEERIEKELAYIAAARNKKLYVWTCTQGIVKHGAEPQKAKSGSGNTSDPLSALDAVLQHVEPAIYLFKDFHPFTEEHRSNLSTIRRLKDVAFHLRDTYKTIVIVAPVMRIAPELDKDVTVLQFRPPDVDDFNMLLDRIIDDVKQNPNVKVNLDAAGREKLVQAARGLTLKEAENVFAKTLVMDGRLDAEDVSVVFSEKQQIIRKSGLLEYSPARKSFRMSQGWKA
jgi:hypothetical protein